MKGLDIGCGYFPTPGWIRLDVNPAVDADVCADASGWLPFADGSMDRVRAVDVLEHISYRNTIQAVTEWARVLKPGGELHLSTPDSKTMWEKFAANPESMVVPEFADHPPLTSLAWRLLGAHDDRRITVMDGDDWRWNAHYALFDPESLTWYLDQAGFDVVEMSVNTHPNIFCDAVKR